jgi:tRNA(Ile)-lysidine synthase
MYIAAVSGGPDSMALLHKYKDEIRCVCHINYKKRKSAKRDENIVKKFCKLANIDFKLLKCTRSVYKKYSADKNFQSMARTIRYDFFAKMGEKYNIKDLLVAHNLDDFLETAKMQLEKKTKVLYIGIREKSMYKGMIIHRPFLNIRKNDLMKYCDDNNVQYGIDETNLTDHYYRNRIRKDIAS